MIDIIYVLIPVYNDWESVELLLPCIARSTTSAVRSCKVLLVDDGSSQPPPMLSAGGPIDSIDILHLQRNVGHQRAICIGLCHLYEHSSAERIVVMDGDGEDDPEDIPRLLREVTDGPAAHIVFAERASRSEGTVFRFFYQVYRLLHRTLVGQRLRVGNFSVMNRACLGALCTAQELWNNFPASAFATRQPMTLVATRRAHRLAGQSKMNFPALVMHGLSSLSVFADRISTRLLIACAAAAGTTLVAMLAVVAIRLLTGWAVPGWATVAFGILAIVLLQLSTAMLTFCMIVLCTRGLAPFIPIRDYGPFVKLIREVYRAHAR
jgi:hypothetical protein